MWKSLNMTFHLRKPKEKSHMPEKCVMVPSKLKVEYNFALEHIISLSLLVIMFPLELLGANK